RKPVVVNRYSIYTKDIKPRGFEVVEIDGYVTQDAVAQTRQVLTDPDLCRRMVDHNYELGRQYFSYRVLHRILKQFMTSHYWL
ncbi:MAG: glycosyltransferase family 1 protein, partial [Desulfobacterales bacterium]